MTEATSELYSFNNTQLNNGGPEIRKTQESSPYKKSLALQKMERRIREGKPLRIAFFDIDSTLTGQDPEATNKVRERLENLGYVVVFVTSRTEEMVISEEEYGKSVNIERPPPI